MGDKTPAIVSMLIVLILIWMSHAKDSSGVSKLRAIGDIMRGGSSAAPSQNGASGDGNNGAGNGTLNGGIGGHGF